MAFPHDGKKFKAGESGNPDGKPKGAIHLSTHIQNALNDPDFEIKLKDGTVLKQMPMEAILKTAIAKSISGDTRAMDWLAKYGYGTKQTIELADPVDGLLGKYNIERLKRENDGKTAEPVD